MRKPTPLPTRSVGRVNFLEGRAGDNSPFHVEDKLVQSSGPSGHQTFQEWWNETGQKQRQEKRIQDLIDHIRDQCNGDLQMVSDVPMAEPTEQVIALEPPAAPWLHVDYTQPDLKWRYDAAGRCIGFRSHTPPRTLLVDENQKWFTLDENGEREYSTPIQRQESPPTTKTEIPLSSGTPPPLQHQLKLDLGLVMESVQLPNGYLHIDAADMEDRVAKAFRLPYPDIPRPWRYGRSPAENGGGEEQE